MMTVASKRRMRSAPPIGPCGSSTPEEVQAVSNKTSTAQTLSGARTLRLAQKTLKNGHERVQLIVMYPMSGIGKTHDARIPEITCASVFCGIPLPAVIRV